MENNILHKNLRSFLLLSFLVFVPGISILGFSTANARPVYSQGTCIVPPGDTDFDIFYRPNDNNQSELIGRVKLPVSLTCSGPMLEGEGVFSNLANAPFFILNVRASGVGSFINVGTFEGTMGGEDVTGSISCTGQTHDFYLTYSLSCVIKGASSGSLGILSVPVVTADDGQPEAFQLKIVGD